jgi:ABC-2 type transport system ATP-binding protein
MPPWPRLQVLQRHKRAIGRFAHHRADALRHQPVPFGAIHAKAIKVMADKTNDRSHAASIVAIHNLSKVYISKERRGIFGGTKRAIEALRGIDLEIYAGEIIGLLGPNGAGKTTLIKCLTTLLLPTEGTIEVNGFDVVRDGDDVRASVGCMLMGERGLYWKLTGRENLDFFGSLYHIPAAARELRIKELIELLGLLDIIDRTVETYSSGQKMKLAFAKSLINRAPILVLDEPTNTLDVPSARELRAIVRDLNDAGHTVIYTTHQMTEAEELCDRVAIIDQGHIIALGTVDGLKASLQQESVIRVEGAIPVRAHVAVKNLDHVDEAILTAADSRAELRVVTPHPRRLLPELIRTLYQNGAVIEDIAPAQVTLEDVFVTLTGRTLDEDTTVR